MQLFRITVRAIDFSHIRVYEYCYDFEIKLVLHNIHQNIRGCFGRYFQNLKWCALLLLILLSDFRLKYLPSKLWEVMFFLMFNIYFNN